jgi:glycosyltransferase involved in cell wall biosynthesis
MTEPPAGAVPRVSVIMNVYNGERLLEQSLRSVGLQTLKDYELLLVDDGSTDRSIEILRAYAARDPRVRLIAQQHRGVGAARDYALRAARAPLVALWDQDDLCRPDRLASEVAFLDANPDVGAVGSYGWRIGEQGRRTGTWALGPTTREEFAVLTAGGSCVTAISSSLMFRAAVAREIGGYRGSRSFTADADLISRISDRMVVLILPIKLVAYRVHAASTSTRRFFEVIALSELNTENAARRREGRPELDPVEWAGFLRAQPLPTRLRRARVWRSRYFYRVAGGLLADHRAAGLVYLGLAVLLAPFTICRRLREQSGNT